MQSNPDVCRRCGSVIDARYCAQCGQYRAEPLTLKRLFRDLLNKLTELDVGLFRTLKDLTIRPGWMIREYLEGNRSSWTNPGKYMFWMATLYALAMTFLVDPDLLNIQMFGEIVSRQQLLLVMGGIAYLAFLFLLGAAAAAYGLFRPTIGSVGEGYVALLYIYGHALLVLSVVAALGHWHPLTVRAFLLVYMIWGLAQLSGGPVWKDTLKAILVYLAYMLCSMATVFIFVLVHQLVTNTALNDDDKVSSLDGDQTGVFIPTLAEHGTIGWPIPIHAGIYKKEEDGRRTPAVNPVISQGRGF